MPCFRLLSFWERLAHIAMGRWKRVYGMVWYVMYKFRNVCTVYVFCVCVCRGKWGYKEWGEEGQLEFRNLIWQLEYQTLYIYTQKDYSVVEVFKMPVSFLIIPGGFPLGFCHERSGGSLHHPISGSTRRSMCSVCLFYYSSLDDSGLYRGQLHCFCHVIVTMETQACLTETSALA